MFFWLLMESFRRQRRRKALAGIAILLGTTAVTAMLALATTIGDRIHRELAVYGANIVVTPKADTLDVKVGGVDLKPATGGAYLKESDLEKLHGIFWANNITGVSPELSFRAKVEDSVEHDFVSANAVGYVFEGKSGAPGLHPSWKLQGSWPKDNVTDGYDAVLGSKLAEELHATRGSTIYFKPDDGNYASFVKDPVGRPTALFVTGVVNTGDEKDKAILLDLPAVQDFLHLPDAISRVEISHHAA